MDLTAVKHRFEWEKPPP